MAPNAESLKQSAAFSCLPCFLRVSNMGRMDLICSSLHVRPKYFKRPLQHSILVFLQLHSTSRFFAGACCCATGSQPKLSAQENTFVSPLYLLFFSMVYCKPSETAGILLIQEKRGVLSANILIWVLILAA